MCQRLLGTSIALSAMLWAGRIHAASYGAECAENYSQPGGCGGTNLPQSCDNVTNAEGLFSAMGYTRTLFFSNGAAFPQDWWEQATVPGGTDAIHMDGGDRTLAIFSGHGNYCPNCEPNNSWGMHFGTPISGQCDASAPGQMIYGERNGDGWNNDGKNKFVIMDASCSMQLDEVLPVWTNWGPGIMMGMHQGMGFRDSPNDGDNRIYAYVNMVNNYNYSNKTAWLIAGEDCYLWWCYNTPSIITHGSNQTDAANRQQQESLKVVQSDVSGWGGWYLWSWAGDAECDE